MLNILFVYLIVFLPLLAPKNSIRRAPSGIEPYYVLIRANEEKCFLSKFLALFSFFYLIALFSLPFLDVDALMACDILNDSQVNSSRIHAVSKHFLN